MERGKEEKRDNWKEKTLYTEIVSEVERETTLRLSE